ncbi:3-phosphoshikimate 1-carboxyvinyltransferase [Cryomorpha ignava]|uniref:3-phosphoshikimate 1-carboxyvinyltransferase n=1 Tax=Cryomorpha ignava TaxID=101383 RepID=A0A7K3WLA8_9FLAO|nr:3-phosphoshikimate 1-carboxyvinyltransferase [Cryomorpha ignava]NEN22426.1 3-phosphoshikimate 1-carboxyvinyltransferase [Cryomorpha ignava]
MGELITVSASKNSVQSNVQINLPASKSISNRLLIMRALSGNLIRIENLSSADDTQILETALGVKSGEVNLGLAGTALRFGMAWAAVTPGVRVLRGDARLNERPVKELANALRELGADFKYIEKEGFAPVEITGKKLNGGKLTIDGSRSSQFITAMMLIAPYCEAPLLFKIDKSQVSMPYVDMTVSLMRKAGAKIEQQESDIKISGAYGSSDFVVEPDWSAASYFYLWAMALEKTTLSINGLPFESVQGDKVASDIFAHYGIISHFTDGNMRIAKKLLPDFPEEINCIGCPDLAQTFAIAAVIAQKSVRLTGLQTLRHKETDRIEALKNELAKCGVFCKAGSDFLEILSFEKPAGTPIIKTYKDHRMAMAFAPLAAIFGEIQIENPGVVSKSFPGYWKEVEKMGLVLESD